MPQHAHIGRHVAIALLVIGSFALIAYGAGVWWFSTHFVPGTTVDGANVGWMDTVELAHLVEARVATYENHVTGNGVDLVITAGDIDLDIDGAAYAADTIAQTNPYQWPLAAIQPDAYDAPDETVTFSHDKLAALVEAETSAINEGATPPTNATGAWNAEASAFEVVSPVAGTMVDAVATTDALAEGVTDLATSTQLGTDELVQPEVTAANETLAAAIERANAMAALSIPLMKDGAEMARVGAAEIGSWVTITPDLTVSIDAGAITAWAGADLAARVANDDEVHVWAIDAEATAAALAAGIDATSNEPVEISMTVVEERPPESDGARARGRHVDVNLSTQYARLYGADGSVLWRSYIVSGNTGNGHGTPTGEYAIQNKVRNMTLVGLDEDHDGEPDYKTPVSYWMPFNGGFGLHDADWRYYFGGTIYQWNGSHGCVNLPVERAAALYDLVNVGDPVIVHW